MHSKLYHTTAISTKLADLEAGLALPQEAVSKLRLAANGIDPALAAGPLAKVLWQACGRHKVLVLRTRLHRSPRQRTAAGSRTVAATSWPAAATATARCR